MTDPFVDRVDGLTERDGRLWLPAANGGDAVAVTVRYLRPLTARTEIVFLDEHEHEVATARGIDAVPEPARRLVEEALRQRYYLSEIRRVDRIHVQFGTRYWDVDTDRGNRSFALREPGKNVLWLGDHHVILRDTSGNRYEIPDLGALDRRSRRWVYRAL